jgi:flagellin
MSVINTNVKALVAQQALKVNNRALGAAMEQLSTGRRINSAADDAAGLAIANRMTSQIRGLDQAVRNANDGISMLQTAEGSMVEVTNMLQRMRELSIQSSTSTNGDADRQYLDLEFQQLRTEIGRITSTTTWNGMKLLDGTNNTQTFHVGSGNTTDERISVTMGTLSASSSLTTTATAGTTVAASATSAQVSSFTIGGTLATNDVVTIKVDDKAYSFASTTATTATFLSSLVTAVNANAGYTGITASTSGSALVLTHGTNNKSFTMTVSVAKGQNIYGGTDALTDILSMANAQGNVTTLDTALKSVNQKRGELGAYINRLNYTIDNLTNISTNSAESRSRVMDADYASATSELAKTQIIQQAATAILAQANQQPQMVLSLLK